MYTKDQKILRFSMLLLFLGLMIVYIVWYQVEGTKLKDQLQDQDSWTGIQITSVSGEAMPTISSFDEEMITWLDMTGQLAPTTWTEATTGITVSSTKTTTGTMTKNSMIKMLSWTSIYYGKIPIIDELGIKYQYALADEKNIRYIYLGTPSYDFASIARALKGTTYTMATEQEILENKLFGNKVVFINLSNYKGKQVIMLVYMNDGIWLIQVEYWLYHKSKAYLKSLFID